MASHPDHNPIPLRDPAGERWLAAFSEAGSWRRLAAGGDLPQVSQAWLDLFCAQVELALGAAIEGPLRGRPALLQGAFVALGEPGSDRYGRAASRGGEAAPDLVRAAERCLQQRRAVVQSPRTPEGACQIAHPVFVGEALAGVVALELSGTARGHLEAVLRLTQWGIPWFSSLFERRRTEAVQAGASQAGASSPEPADQGAMLALAALSALAGQAGTGAGAEAGPDDAGAAAEAFASRLADVFGLDRVAIGLRARGRTRLVAGSHGGFGAVRNDFSAVVLAAMDEAADAGLPLAWPAGADAPAATHAAHGKLCRVHDAGYVLSMPFAEPETDRILVVTVLARQAPEGAGMEGLSRAASIAAPALRARLQAERGLLAHAGAAAGARLRSLAPGRIGLGGAALLCLPLVAAAMFVPIAYSVPADAVLEGTSRRAIVAPFDGFVADVGVRAGEKVAAGAPLGRMDDRELRLQEIDLRARLGETERQLDQAMGQRDHAAANILSARREQSLAQLELIGSNLARTVLSAPFQSFVVSSGTDLVGAPVRRGDALFEVSPLDAYRVTIDVPQGEFAAVEVGQTGRILLSSLPNRRFSFRVERLTPVATAKEGESVVRVEAALEGVEPILRPGMQGVARIDVGDRPIGWVLGHRLWTVARLKLWAFLP